MNKNVPILSVVSASTLFAAVFGALVVQAQPAEKAAPNTAAYEAVLGKSLNAQDVANFITSNRCSRQQVILAGTCGPIIQSNKE